MALGAHLPHKEDRPESWTDEQLYAELASIPEQFKELEAWREKLLGIAGEREQIDLDYARTLGVFPVESHEF